MEAFQSEARSVHALALTGGGYRGLFTARLLERFEQDNGKPVGRCFDLVAGTSIGGILSLAVSFEIPMARVVSTMQEAGPVLFGRKPPWAGILKSKHSTTPLRSLIESLFPANAKIADAKHPVAIPTINLTLGKQQVFKTKHRADWTRDNRYSVVDVALATAAAPFYFPMASFDGHVFADGGLVANSPDLVALHEIHQFYDVQDSAVRMMSVGTLSSSYSITSQSSLKRGVLQWVRPLSSPPLINTILSAQEQFARQLVQHRLGSRYVRLDETPPKEVMAKLGLDIATKDATAILLEAADRVYELSARNNELKTFMSHEPGDWIIKE